MNLARSRSEEARLVERAKIVLACLDGKRNDEVSRELGVRPNTVGLWRKRFAARGIAGLRDQPRPGKKPKYGAEVRLRILRQLELPPPPEPAPGLNRGLAGWDGGTLAAALGVSDAAVWRVLRKEGIQLRPHRSWCVSTDPQFASKAADIIGLYLNPPENALVLSVDEKPSIQALERFCASNQAVLYVMPSWASSWTADMPLECVAMRCDAQNHTGAATSTGASPSRPLPTSGDRSRGIRRCAPGSSRALRVRRHRQDRQTPAANAARTRTPHSSSRPQSSSETLSAIAP